MKNKPIIIITAIIVLLCINFNAFGSLQEDKQQELKDLTKRVGEANKRIEKASVVRGSDFFKLFPNVGVSRQATESEFQEKENHYSASISTSQVFEINDRQNAREAAKLKAHRKLESYEFKIKKLIERKYLILSKIWKLNQIKKGEEDPVEVAKLDDRIDEHTLSIQETEIEIENAYAEIEYTCVEVEKG
ncbi:MAG: hypothetical protein V1874_17850 [Spirochaetota bacterium]